MHSPEIINKRNRKSGYGYFGLARHRTLKCEGPRLCRHFLLHPTPQQVFCELERVLDSELDFRAEAQAMEKIAAGVAHTVDGNRARPPITVPRPVPGLCSGRVLVMEYVQVSE